MGEWIQPVRVPGWGFDLGEARYYGWRWCLHIGPWLLFFAPSPPETE